ncbi:hypothetical protein PFISCL1PPCAC_28749, partial [Pristionchus fissidentatus]
QMLFECPCANVLLVLLGLLVVAYALNRKARYFIRITIFYFSILFNALICMLICLPSYFMGYGCTVVFVTMTYLSKWTGINVEVRDYERVYSKQTTPCVAVCNHQSALDVMMMAHAYPPRGTVMMKRSLAYVPIFNITAFLSEVIFVDRFNREKAMKAVEQCTAALTKRSLKLWVFPEGTRNRSLDGMLEFKKGAFNIAVQAQIPIVPTVASSYKCFYSNPGRYFDGDGEIIVQVMDPIPTAGLTMEDVPALADRVRKEMLVVYEKITAEVNEKMALKRGEKKSQ